jgi:SAM-dependent methyltransferase
MHLNSKLLFEKHAKSLFKNNMKVLEIGPDRRNSSYEKAVNNNTIVWHSLDIVPQKYTTYVSEDPYVFPIPDNAYDIVVSGQVIEHVQKIWIWIKELARVCKKGGSVITIAPVSLSHHLAPVDCWRIYSDGMKTLYEEAGLSIELCKTESLELPPGYANRQGIPGNTYSAQNVVQAFVKRIVKWPITYSLDTIAIGTK